MPRTKISEFSATPANNTDIDSINIAEGCAPSGINDAIRELMAQLKDFQTGAVGDSFNGPIGTSTAAAGAFTTLSASSTLGVTGVATLGAGAILNTPASVTLTNATGLPIATGVSGLGTGVATFLATPSSANLRSALTDETGTGSAVFATSPTLVTPALGTPSSGVVTNLTGTASININGTVGATTASTGAFTTLSASGATTLSAQLTASTGDGSYPIISKDTRAFSAGVTGPQLGFFGLDSTSTNNSLGAFRALAQSSQEGTLEARVLSSGSLATIGTFSSTGLGIGTSSPSVKLDVNGTNGIGRFNSSDANGVYVTFANNGTAKGYIGSAINIITSGSANDFAIHAVNNFVFSAGGAAERMRITSAGDVGIGTTSPDIFSNGFAKNLGVAVTGSGATASINVSGGSGGAGRIQFGTETTRYGLVYVDASNFMQIATTTALPISFGTNNTERARITAAGYVKASDTGTYQNGGATTHEFDQSANSVALNIYATNASYTNEIVQILASRNTSDNTFYAINYYNLGAGAYKFRVADSGNVTNTNNSYGAISDIKLKENILDATPKLEKLNQVRVVNYNFIGNEQKQLGVIAQELEQIFPSMVEESPDKDTEGNDLGTTTKSVKYSVFVPMLIKAIQELKAEFDAYKASHP